MTAGDPPSRPACVVTRGLDHGAVLAGLGSMVARLEPILHGRALVLTRLCVTTPATAPVVHAVVDLLHAAGCSEVAVGGRLRVDDRDRGHRSLAGLARRAGLTGRTPAGRSYEVVDLDDDLVVAPVPEVSVLAGRPVASRWASATTRVVVGRAVTDVVDGYAACLDTLLGAAPEIAGAEAADLVVDLLDYLPPGLVVVDGLTVAAGVDGGRLPRLVDAGVLVAATDPILADSAIAAVLGQDRSASRLLERAVARLGSPQGVTEGVTRVPDAAGPGPRTRAAASALAADPRLERVLRAAIGGPDPDAAPTDRVLGAIRSALTPLVRAADGSAGDAAVLDAVLVLAHTLSHAVHAWGVGFDKDAIFRREVPLGFDPADHDGAAYDGLPRYLAPFEDLVQDVPENADGLRLRSVDRTTVFEVTRDIAAPFEDFVARVDVAHGISLMADYLGGRRVTVPGSTDPTRTRQAERNLYLPQPNYLAAWGGRAIDVCKIELVERAPDRHRLTWRTVASPNGSAEADDGSLTFTRTAVGVRAIVRGRQRFLLPPAWAGVDLDQWPEIRTPLLEDAYRRFFTTTFDNLEACYEGREFRIGVPAPEASELLLTQSVDLLLAATKGWLDERRGRGPTPVEEESLDANGFRHVRGRR